MTTLVLANSISYDNSHDNGMSGGDRILIELLKFWQDQTPVKLITCNSGKRMINRYLDDSLKKISIALVETPRVIYKNLFFLYIYKTISALCIAATVKLETNTVVFSSSDFFPDVLPSFIAKIKNSRNVKWVAAFYLFAPRPFSKEFPYKGVIPKMRGIIYYCTQRICYRIIRKYADYVIACNEVDRIIFIKDGFSANKICTIYGGVDLKIPESVPEPNDRIYDCVFMARFHPQKAPLIAVRAWIYVLKVFPMAKLAMIGNGPDEYVVRKFIAENNLDRYITLFGFMDGVEKYAILKSSKIFIHPAIYETGGMAAAEGMAAGLPVIAFNHEGFKHAYPKGLMRISPVGDVQGFANAIIGLLQDKEMLAKMKKDATDLIQEWDWRKRIPFIMGKITKSIGVAGS